MTFALDLPRIVHCSFHQQYVQVRHVVGRGMIWRWLSHCRLGAKGTSTDVEVWFSRGPPCLIAEVGRFAHPGERGDCAPNSGFQPGLDEVVEYDCTLREADEPAQA